MGIVRGELELQVPDDFIEKIEQRVADGTFLDPSLRYRLAPEPAQLAEASSYRAAPHRRSLHALLVTDSTASVVTEVRLHVEDGRVRYELTYERGSVSRSILFVVVQTIFLAIMFDDRKLGLLAVMAWLASVFLLVKRIMWRLALRKELRDFLRSAAIT